MISQSRLLVGVIDGGCFCLLCLLAKCCSNCSRGCLVMFLDGLVSLVSDWCCVNFYCCFGGFGLFKRVSSVCWQLFFDVGLLLILLVVFAFFSLLAQLVLVFVFGSLFSCHFN